MKLLFSQFTWLFLLFFCVAYRFVLLCSRFHWATTANDTILPLCQPLSQRQPTGDSIPRNQFSFEIDSKIDLSFVRICAVAVSATRLSAASFVELMSSTPQQNKRQTLFSVHDKSKFSFHMENVQTARISIKFVLLFKAAAIWIFRAFAFF